MRKADNIDCPLLCCGLFKTLNVAPGFTIRLVKQKQFCCILQLRCSVFKCFILHAEQQIAVGGEGPAACSGNAFQLVADFSQFLHCGYYVVTVEQTCVEVFAQF